MKTIITMPNYDDATAYLYCYAEELVKFAETNNRFISQLKRPRLWNNMVAQDILGNEEMQCT